MPGVHYVGAHVIVKTCICKACWEKPITTAHKYQYRSCSKWIYSWRNSIKVANFLGFSCNCFCFSYYRIIFVDRLLHSAACQSVPTTLIDGKRGRRKQKYIFLTLKKYKSVGDWQQILAHYLFRRLLSVPRTFFQDCRFWDTQTNSEPVHYQIGGNYETHIYLRAKVILCVSA